MTLSDIINRMIEVALNSAKISSASKTFTNKVTSITEIENPDIESEINNLIEENTQKGGETSRRKNQEPEFLSEKSKAFKELEKQKKDLEKQKRDLEKTIVENKQLKREVDKNNSTSTEELKRLSIAEKTKKQELGKVQDELKVFDTTGIKQINNMSSTQLTNLQGMTKDPFKFMLTSVFKKFARGAGVIVLATIIFTAVQIIISELMKPGRLLERIFRRMAKDEILLFNSREEQAELRQGFRTVTITTIPFLRGSELRGQISGNLYNPTAIPMNRLDERRVIPPILSTQNASRANKFFNRRNRR